ncbi:hypothetical protein [Mycobacterium phage Guo1]|nr:hypothetical protein [Mycobacterium phage Guo1]
MLPVFLVLGDRGLLGVEAALDVGDGVTELVRAVPAAVE